MQSVNIKESSFIRWTDLKFLFISPDDEDLDCANEVLERFKVDTNKLKDLIEDLNSSYKNWHFYLQDSRIGRTKTGMSD